MDSLTQIVLGAACGEAVLGKKIGNKALLFGAIGGTIPDLDVYVGQWIYNNEIQVMAFHRGFMHSIWFAVIGCFVFGWLTFKLYNFRRRRGTTTLKDWIMLYFWALFTHPILDCFTPYGTQLFSPISDYRVAFNTISVADPFYTIPFLFGMTALLFFKRNSQKRRLWFKIGVGASSIYLCLTVLNSWNVSSVFKKSLQDERMSFERFQTQPTILNNMLWYGVAETKDDYYIGFYSLFDDERRVKDWTRIPKEHHLIDLEDPNLKKLIWFSNGYFNVKASSDPNVFRFSDLRYPLADPTDMDSFIFSFKIQKMNNTWDMISSGPRFESKGKKVDPLEFFKPMFQRLKGI
ncbi:metal-dependent hydrolase [Winogradskyella sp. A3E31]|uniref:metal-dependent hydrolase n=1 Tax=Winogradskyella sp. A3E31 TaxID=3349637 RepID=UPI00398BB981